MRLPSAFSRTVGSPASVTATTELVVPRSIPRTLATGDLPPVVLDGHFELLQNAVEPRNDVLALRGVLARHLGAQLADLLRDCQRQPDTGDVDAVLLAERLDL